MYKTSCLWTTKELYAFVNSMSTEYRGSKLGLCVLLWWPRFMQLWWFKSIEIKHIFSKNFSWFLHSFLLLFVLNKCKLINENTFLMFLKVFSQCREVKPRLPFFCRKKKKSIKNFFHFLLLAFYWWFLSYQATVKNQKKRPQNKEQAKNNVWM